jgi:hypothetical protein
VGKKERRKRGKEGREVGPGQNRKGEKEMFHNFETKANNSNSNSNSNSKNSNLN